MNRYLGTIYSQMLEYDIGSIKQYPVPITLMHKKHDLNSDFELARDWLKKLDSKNKNFIEFSKSAHMPFFEERIKFQEELIKLSQLQR